MVACFNVIFLDNLWVDTMHRHRLIILMFTLKMDIFCSSLGFVCVLDIDNCNIKSHLHNLIKISFENCFAKKIMRTDHYTTFVVSTQHRSSA